MNSDHRQRHYTAARVPSTCLYLAPPLRLGWAIPKGYGVPIVFGNRVLVSVHTSKNDRFKCCDVNGAQLWEHNKDPWSLCATRDVVLVTTERQWLNTAHILDPETGIERHSGRAYHIDVLLPDAHRYVGSYTRKGSHRNSVALYSLRTFTEVWRRDAEEFSSRYNFEAGVAAADGRVFVGTGPRLDEGDGLLVALSEENGKQLWALDLRECGGPVQGGKWNPMVSQGLVVINTIGGTVAFDAATGAMKWRVPRAGGRAIYQGRVYVTASGWYLVADLATGEVLLETEIGAAMKKICPLLFQQLATQINVSETHVFAGDADGGLWAWERDTGEVVWHDHPEGAEGFIGVLPVIAGRRLYVGSVAYSGGPSYLYCYEEDHGEGADKQVAPAPAEVTPKKTAKKATASKPKVRKKACPGYR